MVTIYICVDDPPTSIRVMAQNIPCSLISFVHSTNGIPLDICYLRSLLADSGRFLLISPIPISLLVELMAVHYQLAAPLWYLAT